MNSRTNTRYLNISLRKAQVSQKYFSITSKKNNMHFSSIWNPFSIQELYFHPNLSHAWHFWMWNFICAVQTTTLKNEPGINRTQHSKSKERKMGSGNSKRQVLISAEQMCGFSFPDIKCESLKNGTKVEYTIHNTNRSCLIKIGFKKKKNRYKQLRIRDFQLLNISGI